ncbi:MAG: metallophosphoesterase [Simkaniaceae bacterium]|nr:metallophosphoesterase [Candidatus Sacchlamyda saccharinae]
MLKILLVSDTHGDLDSINRLIESTGASLVIHAGDFGFYDSESIQRMSTRELKLRIVHSPFRNQLKDQMTRDDYVYLVETNKLLGDFTDYLSGSKEFQAPVFAVWGNHDDRVVVESLRKDKKVKNLSILDELGPFTLEDEGGGSIQLYGIGGNFLLNEKVLASTLQGEGGKMQSTFHQYGRLYKNIDKGRHPTIFVSHVSPEKEHLLAHLIGHFSPDIWISGHMGVPSPKVWEDLGPQKKEVERSLSHLAEMKGKQTLSADTSCALKLLKAPPKLDRATKNVNLPDIGDGYALLLYEDNQFALETYGNPSGMGYLPYETFEWGELV